MLKVNFSGVVTISSDNHRVLYPATLCYSWRQRGSLEKPKTQPHQPVPEDKRGITENSSLLLFMLGEEHKT